MERKAWGAIIATLKEKMKGTVEPQYGDGTEKKEAQNKIRVLESEVAKLKKDLADEVEEKTLFEDVNKGSFLFCLF